jgi:transglutaminase-like putative cysteine protease
MWFFLVPGEMFIGFYLAPPRLRLRTWIPVAAGFLLFSVFVFSGFSSHSFLYMGAGLASFLLTAIIFHAGYRGYQIAIFEPFFLGLLYWKMLSFSRAAESIARESAGFTQVLFILIVFAFLLHGMVLYLAAYQNAKRGGRRRELFIFLTLVVPAALLIVLLIPANFISHSVVFNILKKEPKPQPIPLDQIAEGVEGGNLLSFERLRDQRLRGGEHGGLMRDGENQGQQFAEDLYPGGKQNMLEGVPSDAWSNRGTGTGGDNKQYAVMIIGGELDPIYVADGYYGEFDPQLGFLLTRNQVLNDLTGIRLIETWKDRGILPDKKRYPRSIFYLSTLSERVLAYRPYKIEPTVLNKRYHPFDYSYNAVSNISMSHSRDWLSVSGLSGLDRQSLKSYLEVPLAEEVRVSFENYLREAVGEKAGYFERIQAIFNSYSTFQYELGFADDVSVAKLESFLLRNKRGDCTEFSNTTAILARLAGIPSRVVTGYLASRNLQTLAHLRGLLMIREVVEPLKNYPLRNLYLVTTAHRHSWVQLYMPGYGWVDFDPTSYAIPPVGVGNPNEMNVVIPIIRIEEGTPIFQFPWGLMLRGFLLLAVVLTICLYVYRYGKELYLRLLSGKENTQSLRALYVLLLMRLSTSGYALKAPWSTPLEYAQAYPELGRFASIYTTLRFREHFQEGEKKRLWKDVRESYREALSLSKRRGLFKALRRLFSLRGLYYR